MKLTNTQLKKIIKEELNKALKEQSSKGFSVGTDSQRYKSIKDPNGQVLQIGMEKYDEPITVSDGENIAKIYYDKKLGKVVVYYKEEVVVDKSMYGMEDHRYSEEKKKQFNSLQELCDWLNQNGYHKAAIGDGFEDGYYSF